MAKKSTKNLRTVTHKKPIPRSYDIYEMEKRIYNLEKNSGGGGATSWDFSTDEVDTGKKWIDGSKIYCKVYAPENQNIVTNTWTNLGVTITGIKDLIDFKMNFDDVSAGNDGGPNSFILGQVIENGVRYYSQTAVGKIMTCIIYYTKTE